jgi:hypothetical protein
MTKTNFILLLLSVALTAGSATAVIVSDASFEDAPEVPDGGRADVKDVTTPWFSNLYGGEPWIGRNYVNSNGYPQVGHDSPSYVAMNYSYIHQQLGATYTDGQEYTLSAWATTDSTGQRLSGYFTVGGTDGWTGATTLDDESLSVTQSGDTTWYQLSYSYTATATDAGQTIGIAFLGDTDVWLDDVTLVPEPMTIGLLGLGAVMLRRRKR